MERLAIIGGGITGVTAAYLLQHDYDITLFEKNDYLGGNNCSSGLVGNSINLPMAVIVFPRKQLFSRTHQLIKELGLTLTRKPMAHAIRHNDEIIIPPKKSCFHYLKQPTRLKDEWYLFNNLKDEVNSDYKTVSDLVTSGALSHEAAWHYLVPVASLYFSMPYDEVAQLPLSIIARWWRKYCCPFYAPMQYSYLKGGNQRLLEALVAQNKKTNFYTGRSVQGITRVENRIEIAVDEQTLTFDKLVMATDPANALKLLQNPTKNEQSILEQFDMGRIKSLVHQNPEYMLGDAITINLHSQADGRTEMMTTWSANGYFDLGLDEEYYTSIMSPSFDGIRDETVLKEHYFDIPLPTQRTLAAVPKLATLNQGSHRVSFCGSYFTPYFYHEDAISSAWDCYHSLTQDRATIAM